MTSVRNASADPIERLATALARTVGQRPIHVVVAPYRVCPIGAHSDHQGGPVLGTAVDAHTLLAFAPSETADVSLVSENFEGEVRFRLDAEERQPMRGGSGWGRYAVAAGRALRERLPVQPRGMTARISGSLPEAGLSSSASVLLAYVTALARVNGLSLAPEEQVELAFRAEHDFVGVQVGVLDPASIVGSRRGHLLEIDTHSLRWEALPLPPGTEEPSYLVVFSGLERNLPGTGYNRRVLECREAARRLGEHAGLEGISRLGELPDSVFEEHASKLPAAEARRARHFFGERARVLEGAAAWREGDLRRFGALMNASCRSSIDNWEAGSEAIIAIQQLLLATDGVLGSRFSGAGFGGSVVALVVREDARAVAEAVRKRLPSELSRARVLILESDDGIRVRLR